MVYVVTTFQIYFLWRPFGSLGARPGRRLGAGLERPSAPHHRPGGARRASSPKARASGGLRLTARTADRRSESPDRLPWGRCGGRLGWRVPGRRPRRGRRRGRLPHDGRRPSIESVRAWRAPLPIQRPKEQRQPVLMSETKSYAQISCPEAKIYTGPENRAGLPSRRTGLPKCPMVLLPIGAAQRRMPAFLAAFRSPPPSV